MSLVSLVLHFGVVTVSGVQCSAEVSLLFAGELNPVATKAQKKVPIPEG